MPCQLLYHYIPLLELFQPLKDKMTRGGKREGAGRPKNPKELNKKMCSFRLSKEEERAVRELLAKMRGKIITLFLLMSLCLPCYANN